MSPITPANIVRRLRGPLLFSLTLYSVELLDELIYGVEGAAIPLIRDALNLNYIQLGLLLTLPMLVANLVDPVIGFLGDVWKRKILIVGGALVTLGSMLLIATGHTFAAIAMGLCLTAPASTAYVSLSQATLMDLNPGRHDQTMARWTILGGVGQLVGPLLISGALVVGLGWRGVYCALAFLAGFVALVFWRQKFNAARTADEDEQPGHLLALLRELPHLIRTSGILRWMFLEVLADLLGDVLFTFCALYFTDVVNVTPEIAGLAVSVLTLGGILGDLALIPILERIDGVRLIRVTAIIALGVYTAFLLVPGLWPKLILLALLGPLRSGWYQVIQGRAYSAMPGKSGTVIAITSIAGLLHAAYPVILGALAENFGLSAAMALLTLGPLSLIIGLPREKRN